MILVDTSVWIEFLKGKTPELTDKMVLELRNRNVLAASPVFGELWQGVKNDREKSIVDTYWRNLPKENETELFIEAGKLSNHYQLFSKEVGLIDCVILSLALKGNHQLWTLDKKLLSVTEEILGVV
ncbi:MULTISPECIES: PIN domain-containing protein [unclassified Imperialibacter]|uniref:PIN domain-containing protein n=1 Tax=unclassified Imperialibacter TaxID=2629706 RepID=UPI001259C4FF|nr:MULTISPECIES: PIN domain-containing protein [unclassified Imperialibacter]CAD5270948.1 PIN domain protein [Imperialibacter sp. 75]CAD5298655.1 PIN domain protein [Imperialibacter sp. 89]VVT35669.1 PIN domain protein [Imperialibacter sp. EC-SDR9]